LTVLAETKSLAAISRLELPAAMSAQGNVLVFAATYFSRSRNGAGT
jgi:hypothetical protein